MNDHIYYPLRTLEGWKLAVRFTNGTRKVFNYIYADEAAAKGAAQDLNAQL